MHQFAPKSTNDFSRYVSNAQTTTSTTTTDEARRTMEILTTMHVHAWSLFEHKKAK